VTPQRWSRLRDLFGAALETPESERLRFVESACEGDTELRFELERLLAGNEEPSLQSPATLLFSSTAELAAGDMVGHYRIEAKLGAGGMGVVYKAYDTWLHREVALKLLRPDHMADPERLQRLMREARAASALSHSNIVTVYEVGSELSFDFIAMEYVDGQSLAHAIPAEGLPLALALSYAIEIAAALGKAHSAGIIHRDLKPANIMLTGEGHIKLLDFGLARQAPTAESETASVTAEGQVAGTIGYMSPEQVRGLSLNHRTDIFSFGVVLYEMVTGQRPFQGNSAMAVCDAILHAQPREFGKNVAPRKLKFVVGKLLEKDQANRYGSADEVQLELMALEASLTPVQPVRLSRNARIVVGAAVVLLSVLAGWLWERSSRERWALQTATPEIGRLVDAGEYVKAATLAREARAVLPKDPTLEKLWMLSTGEVSMVTEPAGADVSIRPYRGDPNDWRTIGKTPLRKVRVPRDDYVWRFAKLGFTPSFYLGEVQDPGGALEWGLKLRPEGSVPPEMVPVMDNPVPLTWPLAGVPEVYITDFLIDRHEVTNQEYKKFVDAGGYRRQEFWKQPFERDGRAVRWDEAVALFRDPTGRPGPATWEVGDYPKGHQNYPVAGVSWYEAAAYAEFVGKTLPTAYHWMGASQAVDLTQLITPGSNFGGRGPQPVGSSGALSGSGTTDMAGNVKEWCLNEGQNGKRLILGGGFDEPRYMFNFADQQSPWDRRSNFGFRCVKLDSAVTAAAAARIVDATRDYWKEKPVSDEVFKAYTALYAYDKGALNARVEETAVIEGGSRSKVTFDAAYGRERVTAYLFLPKDAVPPLQTIMIFPAATVFLEDKLDLSGVEYDLDFLLKSGRALILPIFKGMYERRDGFVPGRNKPAFFRDHVIAWSKDLGRSLDYLETRQEFDVSKTAYLGLSLGGTEGALLTALEKRIKTAIFSSGGFQNRRDRPEVDPFNFVSHVTIPVLMFSGRYDYEFPVQSSQDPLFHFLGTPNNDKKHVIYEGGHMAFPRPAAVRECLDWLDKYLGPVRH
jgi:serine/threonine protein kinase/formylglycine-generating enzyme required for sulfatase activity